MSQKKYRRPLDLRPCPSQHLFFILLAAHLLAISALLLPMTLSWYGRIAILVAIFISAYFNLYHNSFNKIKHACWKTNGGFDLALKEGKNVYARLSPHSLVTEWLVVLHLMDTANRKYTWLLLSDMLDRETYRRLCVRLRQWRPDAVGEKGSKSLKL